MLKAAIDRILNLAEPNLVNLGDETYTDKDLHRIPFELTARPLQVHTLTAILDYITSGCDEQEDDINRKFVIHVENQKTVRLYHELNSDKVRECLLEACVEPSCFPFGRWLNVEDFIIQMQSHFVDSWAVDSLIQLVSNIVDENSVTTTDDGKTQQVTARSGIALVKKEDVPNPIDLAPYRTFNEIEQPESSFVFRIRKGDKGIEAALFTADGNAWINDAIIGIRDWFAQEIPVELRDEVIILA